MDNSAVNAAASDIANININAAGNFAAIFQPPGAVPPYVLSEDGTDEVFDPISSCAIRELGRYGPLNEENLREFLRRKIHLGMQPIRDVVQQYTEDMPGLRLQLEHLRNRMNQIKDCEKDKTKYLQTRIKDFMEALKKRKPLPKYKPHELNLSFEAKKAFMRIGSQGPLTESELILFIHTGNYNTEILLDTIINQLKDLRLRIYDNADTARHNYKLPYQRILKAIRDILDEMMALEQ